MQKGARRERDSAGGDSASQSTAVPGRLLRCTKTSKPLVTMIIQTALTQLYPHNAQNRKMHSCAEEMVAYFKDEKLFTALGFQPMTHETLMDWLKEIPAERKGRREQTRVRAIAHHPLTAAPPRFDRRARAPSPLASQTGAGDDPTGGDGDAAISPLDALLDEYLDEWKKQSEAKVAAKTAPVDPVRARNAEEVVACANRGRKRPATVSLLGDDEEEEEEQSPSASGKGSKPRNALAKFDQLGEGLLELTAQSNDIRKDRFGPDRYLSAPRMIGTEQSCRSNMPASPWSRHKKSIIVA
mmetsp:Transcript_20974/g.49097  ORF Transcript_20974/g.49097 Transcript_20974/m.49097 type:complete len:298 (+) Transcript_20974:182-1075(+)